MKKLNQKNIDRIVFQKLLESTNQIFQELLNEDPVATSLGGVQPTNPYGPTNAFSPYQNMNQYLSNPFNPDGQAFLAPTWPYPVWATGEGSEFYDYRGYKRSLNRPIAMPRPLPGPNFDPNDPFWQTDTGKWFLSQLAGMLDNWNNSQWWTDNSTFSFENRYDALQNFIRQISTMVVGTDSQGNPIYVTPPDVQDTSNTSWRNLI